MLCKPFYIANLLKELNSNGTYARTDLTVDALVVKHRALLKSLALPFIPEDFDVCAYFYSMLKAHKDPLGHRFVSASHRSPIAPLSLHLNHAFDALRDPVDNLWRDTLLTGGIASPSSWILHKPDTLLSTLKLANVSLRQAAEKEEEIEDDVFSTFDFSTLYTLIPHSELKLRLKNLFTLVFKQQATRKYGSFSFLAVQNQVPNGSRPTTPINPTQPTTQHPLLVPT